MKLITDKLPAIQSNRTSNIQNIVNSLATITQSCRRALTERNATTLFGDMKEHYQGIFGAAEVYELSDADLARIQRLVNELRKLISESKLITAEHKGRLLRRLEGMQRELHKNTSDIDRFWGFVAEAGIVARKFGEDLKPISERVTELGTIVITVVMAKEGIKALPDIAKLLGH